MISKSIISREPDGSIAITYYHDRDNYDDIIKKHVTAWGRTLIEAVDGEIEKPSDKTNRDCWDFKNGKVVIDNDKVLAKQAKLAEKENKRQSVLAKLKISEDELADLLKR